MQADPSPSWLNPTQKRILAAAVTSLAIGILVLGLAGVFQLLRWFIQTFSNVLWPIATAGILAMLLQPLVGSMQDRLRLSRVKSISLLYTLGSLLLLAIGSNFIPLLLSQAVDLIHALPDLLAQARDAAMEKYPQIIEYLRRYLSDETINDLRQNLTRQAQLVLSATLPAVQTLGGWLKAVGAFSTGLAIIPVYLFFFLLIRKDPIHGLQEELAFLPGSVREDVVFLLREFIGSVVAFFRGQILIGLIMGVLLAVGFSVIHLRFGILIGLAFGVLNIVPYLGTIIGLSVALPVALFQPEGGVVLAGLTLGVFFLTQVLEAYVLTPRIMGHTTGLHPMAIIIAIFFWGTAFDGVLGMVLAIPLTAFFVVFWRLLQKKYLPRWQGLWGTAEMRTETDAR